MRKVLFALFIVFAVAAVIFLIQQTNTLKISHYTWQSGRVPQVFDGFRIVQLSDLHSKRFGRAQERLLRAVRAAEPDIIALTGDFIDDHTRNLNAVRELLEGIRGLAPIYFVEGNHDTTSPFRGALLALLSQYDVTILDGYTQLERKCNVTSLSATMSLAGFPYWEPWNFRYPADIVLYHSPEMFFEFAAKGCGLVIAGHNHGGQVALPSGRALIGPRIEFFPQYSSGVYHESGATMILSRGLGVSRIPFRAFATPEIVVIELKSE